MKLSQTTQFRKDVKKQIKRGKDIKKLTDIIEILLKMEILPPDCKDHQLQGQWRGRRDCHVEPDWVLIYRLTDEELRLERTGSHGDLF